MERPAPNASTRPRSEVIMLGTGTSEGVPRLSCLVEGRTCKVCHDAMQPGSKNRRRNTGLIIRTHRWVRINKIKSRTMALISLQEQKQPSGEFNWVEKIIMIDCGKFWFHSALEHFPRLGINKIDAILVTHAHADAVRFHLTFEYACRTNVYIDWWI